jgi:hypothetical protein
MLWINSSRLYDPLGSIGWSLIILKLPQEEEHKDSKGKKPDDHDFIYILV